jgi:ABC-type transport system substrate-binding protein
VEEAAERYGRDGFRPYVIEVLYGLNLKNPKFADLRFREAIVRAIDRDAIVKAVYGGNTLSLSGLVPAGVPGHRDDACGDACRHDPAAARALVTQAFAGRPVPGVQIDYEDDPTQEAVAKAMQANLAGAGIPAATRPHPFSEYLTFASSGAQELFHFTSNGAYPSPDAFLTPLFLTAEPDNVTQLSLPPVDNLLKRARSEPSEANRISLYQQAEQLILSQAPVVPVTQYESHTVVSRRVQGLMLSPLGTFDASQVRLVDAR